MSFTFIALFSGLHKLAALYSILQRFQRQMRKTATVMIMLKKVINIRKLTINIHKTVNKTVINKWKQTILIHKKVINIGKLTISTHKNVINIWKLTNYTQESNEYMKTNSLCTQKSNKYLKTNNRYTQESNIYIYCSDK